jgi:hypothetical protein
MGIAVPSTFVSIGDLDSVKNALQVMYNYQVSGKSKFKTISELTSDTESHHRSISRSWTPSFATRLRHISYVDHDWYIQLHSVQQRYNFPQTKLGQISLGNEFYLWESWQQWASECHRTARLGEMADRIQWKRAEYDVGNHVVVPSHLLTLYPVSIGPSSLVQTCQYGQETQQS